MALTAVIILGLGLWTTTRRNAAPLQPVVTLVQPAQDTALAGDLELRFHTNLPLRLQPTGWGSGRFHLHAMVNDRELMPGAADIRDLGNGQYEWHLTNLPDSAHIQLVWALPTHQRLQAGASHTILVRQR